MNFFTELKEGLAISWSAIRANKMRSILTTLGIVIGIVTVTLMGTAIEGVNHAFLKAVSFIGADVLFVQREDWSAPGYGGGVAQGSKAAPSHVRAVQRAGAGLDDGQRAGAARLR